MTHSRASKSALLAAALLASLPLAHGQIVVQGKTGKPGSGVVHTGLHLEPGDGFSLKAKGKVTIFLPGASYFGPDGEPGAFNPNHWVPTAPNGALIGEIGGEPRLLGSQYQGGAWAKGELVLGVNDHFHLDNGGSFSVKLLSIPSQSFWTSAGVQPGTPMGGILATIGGGGAGNAGSFGVGGTKGCSGWLDTGLDLTSGETLITRATGKVTAHLSGGNYYGPNGESGQFKSTYCVDNAEIVSLIARVGNGAPFKLGEKFTGVVSGPGGRLLLGINDDFYPDNAGSFLVKVSLAATAGGGAGGGAGSVDRPARDGLTVNGSSGTGAARDVLRERHEPLLIELALHAVDGARGVLYLWPAELAADLDQALACGGAMALPLSPEGVWEAPRGVGRAGRYYVQGLLLTPGTGSPQRALTERVLLVQR